MITRQMTTKASNDREIPNGMKKFEVIEGRE